MLSVTEVILRRVHRITPQSREARAFRVSEGAVDIEASFLRIA
jgi:hypothetical protein